MPVELEQGLKPVSSNLRRPPSPGLPHGKFLPWIADEFEMSQQTAQDFMRVFNRFGGEKQDFLVFKPSVLYSLASPSTPESVVEKAIEKAEAGECRNYRSHVDFKSPHQKQETPTCAWLIGVFICVWRNINWSYGRRAKLLCCLELISPIPCYNLIDFSGTILAGIMGISVLS